ncbi:MAG: 3-deoxy-D-manno-octulosonic acid transferase [Gammaproteobacteria bacterium]|nr:MAG: 3-deoxy-D-manno-octulosonic acid transferase [Gammaproteobacteria bacterium]
MIYRLLIWFFWPVLFVYTLRLALRYKSLRYLRQRLGFGYRSLPDKPIWIHCASVGEVNTALPLVQLLVEKYPQQQVIISTNTCTGAAIVERNPLHNVQHCYLPLDSVFAVNRFLGMLRPQLAIMLETELWPTLYGACRKKSIPLVIINARLSARTLEAKGFIRKEYAKSLRIVDHVLARSSVDKSSFLQLGADENAVEVTGNLKFAHRAQASVKTLSHFTERPYVLAASTHDDEELQLASVWQQLQRKDYLLVIAPRHPERGLLIARQLEALHLNIALRSRQDVIDDATDVYIADTIGELTNFIDRAELVFMGGSLIARGGQNLLEPARLQRPIIVGPHMENFQAEVDLFLQHQACVQVQDKNELALQLAYLLEHEEKRQQLVMAASRLMAEQGTIAETYLNKLVAYYPQLFA